MKKKMIYAIIISVIAAIAILIVLSLPGGYQSNSIQFSVQYKDSNALIATSFDFEYNSVKKEIKSVIVELNENSILSVFEFYANSACKIIIYDNRNKPLWSQEIENNSTYTDLVNVSGEYELSLVMNSGSGKGVIKIE